MERYQIDRRERQRAELDRRAPMDRRAAWLDAMRLDKAQRDRRTAQRRAVEVAKLADWKTRYDAALAKREAR